MRDSHPQLLNLLLNDTSTLRDVQQRVVILLKLNRAVKGLLPSQLQPFCRVANFRQGVLVLETNNASWLMRLRYEQSTLISALRAEVLPSLASIEIRINPALVTKTSLPPQNNYKTVTSTTIPHQRSLSEQSGERLKELASHAPENLRKKLRRLASLAGARQKN